MTRTSLLAMVLAVTAAAGLKAVPPRRLLAEGEPLPAFELATPDGARFSSAALGGTVAIVAFVRPAQESSAALLRDLEKLAAELEGVAFERIAIFAGGVSAGEVSAFCKEAGFSGRVLLDPERRAYGDFGVVAVPSVALFGRDSNAVYSRPGYGASLFPEVSGHLRRLHGKAASADGADAARSLIAPRIALASRLVEEGKLDEAEELLRRVLDDDRPLEAYVLLAEVHIGRGQAEEALELLTAAGNALGIAKDPRLGAARARALTALGKHREAETLLGKVLVAGPGCWEAHVALGELHEKLGRKDLALAEYKKAIAILARARPSS